MSKLITCNQGLNIAFTAIMSLYSAKCFSGWEGPAQIEYLYSGSVGGRTAIGLVGENPNPANCAKGSDLIFDTTSPEFPWMWSIIMTAYSKDLPIHIFINSCDTVRNQPLVKDVRLHRESQ